MNSHEFDEFTRLNESPPPHLGATLLSQVKEDLHPSALRVFSKLAGIHFFTALLTLSVCPQFGIRVFGEGLGLMGKFMQLGDYGCMVACGSFFMGSSVLLASLILRSEEIRALRQNQILELGALALLSIGFFIMLHAEIVIGYAFAWALGTLLGGWISLELGTFLRSRLAYTD